MLRVMRDDTVEPADRDAMAKAAAPYLHPQLSAVAFKELTPDGRPIAPQVNIQIVSASESKPEPKVVHEARPALPPSATSH